MIPRPSEAEILAEVHAHDPHCEEKKKKWLLDFLKNCEYAGDGRYVVTVRNQSFGKNDKRVYPPILACPYDPPPLPN